MKHVHRTRSGFENFARTHPKAVNTATNLRPVDHWWRRRSQL